MLLLRNKWIFGVVLWVVVQSANSRLHRIPIQSATNHVQENQTIEETGGQSGSDVTSAGDDESSMLVSEARNFSTTPNVDLEANITLSGQAVENTTAGWKSAQDHETVEQIEVFATTEKSVPVGVQATTSIFQAEKNSTHALALKSSMTLPEIGISKAATKSETGSDQLSHVFTGNETYRGEKPMNESDVVLAITTTSNDTAKDFNDPIMFLDPAENSTGSTRIPGTDTNENATGDFTTLLADTDFIHRIFCPPTEQKAEHGVMNATCSFREWFYRKEWDILSLTELFQLLGMDEVPAEVIGAIYFFICVLALALMVTLIAVLITCVWKMTVHIYNSTVRARIDGKIADTFQMN